MTHVKEGCTVLYIYPTSQFDYRAMHTYGRLTSSSSRRGHSLSQEWETKSNRTVQRRPAGRRNSTNSIDRTLTQSARLSAIPRRRTTGEYVDRVPKRTPSAPLHLVATRKRTNAKYPSFNWYLKQTQATSLPTTLSCSIAMLTKRTFSF